MLVTSSAISSDGSRASAAATASRCSSPPDSPPVSRSASPSRPTSSSSRCTSVLAAGRQPPHHVVGHPGAEHLALGVLHDHRGAAELAQPDRAGPLHRARRRFAPGQHQHQRRLARSRWRRSPRRARRVRRSATPDRARRGRRSGSGSARRAAAPAPGATGPVVGGRRRACARRECRRSRSSTRDSAHQPISVTIMMLSTDVCRRSATASNAARSRSRA